MITRRLWSGIGLAVTLSASAAESTSASGGYPLIRSFDDALDTWGGGSQNFGIAIDSEGVLYLANLNGVMVLDGAHATVIPIGVQQTAFSVAIGVDGHVAVGGDSEFGLLEADAQGRPTFRSLVPPEMAQAGDFGQTFVDGFAGGFVFMAGSRLHLWDGDALVDVATFGAARPWPRAFSVGNQLYVWDQVGGLRRLVGAQLEAVSGGDLFRGRRIDGLATAPNGLLVSVRGEGFFLLVEGRAIPFAGAATTWALASRVLEARQLPDGRWAFGSLLGGILLLHPDGTVERVIDTAAGLTDAFVWALAVDAEGSLWLAQNSGLASLEIASPLSVYDARSGLEGGVQAIHRHRGELWVGTSSGVFTTAGASGPRPFRPLPEIRDGGWSFASAGDDLLVASAFGVSVVGGSPGFEKVREIPGTNTWTVYSMATSRADPDRIWLGLSSGLGAARRTREGWVFEGRIAGLDLEVRGILEDADGTLWLSHAIVGYSRVQFAGRDLASARIKRYPNDSSQDDSWLFAIGDERFVARGRQIRRMDPRDGSLKPKALLELASDLNAAVQDSSGRLWLNSVPPAIATRNASGWTVASTLFNLPSRSIERIYAEPDGVVWLGGDRGLFRHEGAERSVPVPLPQLRFGRIVADSQRLLFGGSPAAAPEAATLEAAVRRLRVEFAPHSFRPGLRYQTRLLPLDEDWGPWSADPYIEFTRLPAGSYTLEVRSGGPTGELSAAASWSFAVQPPWYRQPWALGLWLLLALLTVRGYGGLQSRTANARAAKLERLVAEKTVQLTSTVVELQRTQEDLESANERLLDLSTLDELTGLANRRLFDARLAEEWARARRNHEPVALILADLDHFKRLNDSLGHPAGDACLRAVAHSFREALRRSLDLVARYGGEEFAVILPGAPLSRALDTAEELRAGVEQLRIAAGGTERVTASFGVALLVPGEGSHPLTLIEAADQALYRAKRGGRNRVVGPAEPS